MTVTLDGLHLISRPSIVVKIAISTLLQSYLYVRADEIKVARLDHTSSVDSTGSHPGSLIGFHNIHVVSRPPFLFPSAGLDWRLRPGAVLRASIALQRAQSQSECDEVWLQ